MHTITQLRAEMFSVRVRDDAATIDDVFPDWGVLDRLGIVIDEPLGGLGASHLIQIAISRFTTQVRAEERSFRSIRISMPFMSAEAGVAMRRSTSGLHVGK